MVCQVFEEIIENGVQIYGTEFIIVINDIVDRGYLKYLVYHLMNSYDVEVVCLEQVLKNI